MGLYVSTEQRMVKQLPNTVLSEFSTNLLVIRKDTDKYIVLQDISEILIEHHEVKLYNGKSEIVTSVKVIRTKESLQNGLPWNVLTLFEKNSPQFRTGLLPFKNIRIVETERDEPGGELGILVTWGAIRQISYSYKILAELAGTEAEFDVTDCLRHYITPELTKSFRKKMEELDILKMGPEERMKIYLQEELQKLSMKGKNYTPAL